MGKTKSQNIQLAVLLGMSCLCCNCRMSRGSRESWLKRMSWHAFQNATHARHNSMSAMT